MKRYKNLYLWMFVPFLIVQIGIFNYYWPRFVSQTWEIHFHYWLVSLWYLLLIIQPYLAVKDKLTHHKTLGIFGFLLAGGVLFTALSILDIPLKLASSYNPNRPGPPLSFYYGTLVIEFISIVAFAFAIFKGIVYRHNLKEHTWWLIASAFYMMAPALGRGMIVFWRSILPPENFKPILVPISTELIYLSVFLLFAFKFGKIKHLATLIGFILILVRFLRIPIGSSEAVQELLKTIIKW